MIYKPKPARHAMFRLSPQFLTQFKIRWRCSRRVTGFQHGVTYLLWLIYACGQLEQFSHGFSLTASFLLLFHFCNQQLLLLAEPLPG